MFTLTPGNRSASANPSLPTTQVTAKRCEVRALVLAILSIGMIGTTSTFAAPPAKAPEWKTVEATVKKTLAKREDYQPQDILSRSDLQKVVAALKLKGWKVSEGQQLVERALPDDDILVQLLRGSKKGLEFMRGSAKYDLAYDRLDRMIRFYGGVLTIKQLIKGPDGYKMVQYFTETAYRGNCIVDILPRGENGQLPSSKGFNEPTGKIYTEKMLLTELKELYKRQFPLPKAAGRETVYPR